MNTILQQEPVVSGLLNKKQDLQKAMDSLLGYGPGLLGSRTPLPKNIGTPLGTSRCPGGMASPRFSAPTPVDTWLPGMPMVAASTVFLVGKTTN